MSTTGGVSGGGTVQQQTQTSAVSSGTSTASGETEVSAEQNLEEHEKEWATENQQINSNPKLYASLYSSGAGTGNNVLPNGEVVGGSSNTGGGSGTTGA